MMIKVNFVSQEDFIKMKTTTITKNLVEKMINDESRKIMKILNRKITILKERVRDLEGKSIRLK